MSASFNWPGTLNAKINAEAGSTFQGAITGTSSFTGQSVSATSSIGYATGAGGAVTQLVNKAEPVELNKICGAITTTNAQLNAATSVTFAVTNTICAPGDVVVACVKSGGTAGAYQVDASEPSGTGFKITVRNITAGNLSEALVINFIIIKAVAA
jgi:hypothetical protein